MILKPQTLKILFCPSTDGNWVRQPKRSFGTLTSKVLAGRPKIQKFTNFYSVCAKLTNDQECLV